MQGNTRSKLVHSKEDKSFCLGGKNLSFQWRAQSKDVLSGAAAAISNTIRGVKGEDSVKTITKKQNPIKNYSVVCVCKKFPLCFESDWFWFSTICIPKPLIQFGYIMYYN